VAEGESGLADWINMFATPFIDDLAAGPRAQIMERAVELVRPALFVDGRWSVDYRRIRFVAFRVG
jgi:hypothetical protein